MSDQTSADRRRGRVEAPTAESRRAVGSTSGYPSRGYGTGARLFHWVIAVLLVVQIPAGIGMTSEPLAGFADRLFILHKGLGTILLVLVILRLAWRLTHRVPDFPAHMPALEQKIAHRTHWALYLLLIVMGVSGYLRTVADNYPIELLNALGIAPLVTDAPELARAMLVVHQFTVIALVALIAVHVAEVLRHRLVLEDGILSRMWPPFGNRDSSSQTRK